VLPNWRNALCRVRRGTTQRSSLQLLFVYDFDLLIGYLPGEAIDCNVHPVSFFAFDDESNERFDFAERCWSGKRQAFGLVQSDPLIDRFA
jgi:hypothetical protein